MVQDPVTGGGGIFGLTMGSVTRHPLSGGNRVVIVLERIIPYRESKTTEVTCWPHFTKTLARCGQIDVRPVVGWWAVASRIVLELLFQNHFQLYYRFDFSIRGRISLDMHELVFQCPLFMFCSFDIFWWDPCVVLKTGPRGHPAVPMFLYMAHRSFLDYWVLIYRSITLVGIRWKTLLTNKNQLAVVEWDVKPIVKN